MDCDNVEKLLRMIVGVNVMCYMSIHAFQDVLFEIDVHLRRCNCDTCLKIEKQLEQAKTYYAKAVRSYWVASDLCEQILTQNRESFNPNTLTGEEVNE